MDDLLVFILQFEGRAGLDRAFAAVCEDEDLVSCLVEAETLQVRFLSTLQVGGALVERLYDRVGFVWCKRYEIHVQARLEAGKDGPD